MTGIAITPLPNGNDPQDFVIVLNQQIQEGRHTGTRVAMSLMQSDGQRQDVVNGADADAILTGDLALQFVGQNGNARDLGAGVRVPFAQDVFVFGIFATQNQVAVQRIGHGGGCTRLVQERAGLVGEPDSLHGTTTFGRVVDGRFVIDWFGGTWRCQTWQAKRRRLVVIVIRSRIVQRKCTGRVGGFRRFRKGTKICGETSKGRFKVGGTSSRCIRRIRCIRGSRRHVGFRGPKVGTKGRSIGITKTGKAGRDGAGRGRLWRRLWRRIFVTRTIVVRLRLRMMGWVRFFIVQGMIR
jgi:hypothetical protein